MLRLRLRLMNRLVGREGRWLPVMVPVRVEAARRRRHRRQRQRLASATEEARHAARLS